MRAATLLRRVSTHDRLLHFVRESPWDDRAVRREVCGYIVDALQTREPITTWIVDDTGFLKQGSHSPGVQRQYTGSAGKIANCQLGVSLCIATRTEQVPIDFELYLPKSWTEDAERREKARIPEEMEFKTKTRLALDMIERAVADGVPGEVVLADSFYGRWSGFRETVRELGLDYAVAVDSDTLVWPLDKLGRRCGDAVLVRDLASKLGRIAFRRKTWRQGTKGKLSSHFYFQRVKVAHDDGTEPADREPVWLVIEWPKGESKPTKFVLTTLPRRMSKKQIVRTIKERWKTERVYQELKGQLGLDHFEGRSFTGWHHHESARPLLLRLRCCGAGQVFFPLGRRDESRPSGRRRGLSALQLEGHGEDSFATARIAIAKVLALWLPRCPLCHRHCNCPPRRGSPKPPHLRGG